MISKDQWIWMPHAGHLIVGSQCRFKLNTKVGDYIVSTVGEYVPDSQVRKISREIRGRQTDLKGDAEEADYGFEDIGFNRKYETMVFKAKKSEHGCCPYEQVSGEDIDFDGYKTAEEAYKGHMEMCEKWASQTGSEPESK